jgi:hypothetical protein
MGPVHNKLATGLYQCEVCQRASMCLFEDDSSGAALLGAWPRMRGHANEALPRDVDLDRVEAWNCFFGAEHRAAVVMARSAFRRALWSLDPLRSSPSEELDNIVTSGLLTAELAQRVDAAELVGAGGAEELGSVDEQLAETAVTTLDEFLEATIAPPVR